MKTISFSSFEIGLFFYWDIRQIRLAIYLRNIPLYRYHTVRWKSDKELGNVSQHLNRFAYTKYSRPEGLQLLFFWQSIHSDITAVFTPSLNIHIINYLLPWEVSIISFRPLNPYIIVTLKRKVTLCEKSNFMKKWWWLWLQV